MQRGRTRAQRHARTHVHTRVCPECTCVLQCSGPADEGVFAHQHARGGGAPQASEPEPGVCPSDPAEFLRPTPGAVSPRGRQGARVGSAASGRDRVLRAGGLVTLRPSHLAQGEVSTCLLNANQKQVDILLQGPKGRTRWAHSLSLSLKRGKLTVKGGSVGGLNINFCTDANNGEFPSESLASSVRTTFPPGSLLPRRPSPPR